MTASTSISLMEFTQGHNPDATWAKIPWHEQGFSSRMLKEHLCQSHDWASRNETVIDRQAALIHSRLPEQATILDLGCGPGLYTERLADFGHSCTGVDISPASIAWARERDVRGRIQYILSDILSYAPSQHPACKTGFDALLMLFGEINAFPALEAKTLLARAAGWLNEGGALFLEVHTFDAVRAAGLAEGGWKRLESGLFSEEPHICLEEHAWDEQQAVSTSLYHVINARTCRCTQYASSLTAYTEADYEMLLGAAGFTDMAAMRGWPVGDCFDGKLRCLVCTKPGGDSR